MKIENNLSILAIRSRILTFVEDYSVVPSGQCRRRSLYVLRNRRAHISLRQFEAHIKFDNENVAEVTHSHLVCYFCPSYLSEVYSIQFSIFQLRWQM